MAKTDNFFTLHECQRCQSDLISRIQSWFTEEVICMNCHDKELELRKQIRAMGVNDNNFEGCGYVPKVGEEKIR